MKNWNSVEEKWREQLQNKSDDIPEGLWSRLEERLEEKPTRRFPIYWAAAAMLLIAVGLSWNWNAVPEETRAVTSVAPAPSETEVSQIVEESSEMLASNPILTVSISAKADEQEPVQISEPVVTEEIKHKEEVVAVQPLVESKAEPEEIVTVRLDIDPIQEEEERPVAKRRKRSLFGKIVGEIRQALDGEPVNWQKLKEGNPTFENNIHTVANTYVKTEENLKRTLQIQ
jgi:cytoskeletal protein RodZ